MTWPLAKAERGVLIGMTRTGKSTLATELIRRFLTEYPNGQVFIVDSKPRFRAEYNASGVKQFYKNWVRGDTFSNSVAIAGPYNLESLYKLFRVVILQSTDENGNIVNAFESMVSVYAAELFRMSGPRHPTLFYIDEWYDVLGGGLAAVADKRLLKTLRAGGEKNMAVLGGAQRPRSIPLPQLTEATKMYIFYLEFEEDRAYLRKHGPTLHYEPIGHQFVFYERDYGTRRVEKLMELQLET